MPVEPRRATQRVEVGLEHEVAVAALPARHRVAVDGVHVDVDGEQVVAALGAVADHRLQEPRRRSGACPAGGPACRSGPAGRCRCRLRRSRPSARRGSWPRPYLAGRCPWQLWSAWHTNARARRHHRPPGARARPAGGRARSRSTAASPTATTACGWAARTSSCACATAAPRCWASIAARRRSPRAAPPPRASRPPVVAFLSDVPALVTRWLPGGDVARRAHAHAGRDGAGRRDAAPRCTAPRRCRRAFAIFRLVEEQRALAGALPDSYERSSALLAPHRGGAPAAPSTCPSPATTTC